MGEAVYKVTWISLISVADEYLLNTICGLSTTPITKNCDCNFACQDSEVNGLLFGFKGPEGHRGQ